ncbi:MAG: hypothetical protein D6731_07380 [Planctomycetota bacterium]|nr:MAG: hypothetical protein D6731_07380 [Planctomycetota bacterium]
MPTIQFGGLASGLDTQALIDGLLAVERLPIQRMEADKTQANAAKGIFSDLSAKLSDLEDLAAKLDDAQTNVARTATSSDAGLEVSATSSAVPGVHEVVVTQRAAATTLASQNVADSAAAGVLGSGTLSITVGGTVTNIAVAAGNDSLEAVRDAINASGAAVQASVINDGSATPYRLVIRGTSTGTSNAVSVDASGLSGGTSPLVTTELVAARDAQLTVDGIPLSRASNVVSDVIDGVTLDLRDEAGTPITVTVATDLEAAREQVQELVDAYNEVLGKIAKESQPGVEGAPGGPLLGDFVADLTRRRLGDAIAQASGGGTALPNLSALGLATERDGTLQFDAADFDAALGADPDAAATLLADAAARLVAAADELSKSGGLLDERQKALDTTVRDLERQIDRKEDSLERKREMLVRRFSVLETISSTFQAQSNFLAGLTGGTNNDS